MDFLKTLVRFLSTSVDADGVAIMPPEVQATDVDREKTFLMKLPEAPVNVYVLSQYDIDIASMTPKQVGVRYLQVIVRHQSQGEAIKRIERLWLFLLQRPEFVEDLSEDYWVMFDVKHGPVPLESDQKGNYLYSLSFVAKTNLY